MAKNKTFAGLDSLPELPKKTDKPQVREQVSVPSKGGGGAVVGGREAAQKARKATRSKKKRTLTLRLSQDDTEIIDKLARKLKKKGLQYSDANAVRLALRCFDASDERITEIADEIKSEDGRSLR